jgi:hypothetical protein
MLVVTFFLLAFSYIIYKYYSYNKVFGFIFFCVKIGQKEYFVFQKNNTKKRIEK